MKTTIYEREYRLSKDAALKLGQSTLIMGILNVTPDSFSDGGRYNDTERAVEHALQLIEEGADIIDIGGESTRPGHEPVGASEELARVIPVIEAIHRHAPQIPLSIDTYKAEVARQAIGAGAHIMNDIWGFKHDPDMPMTAAELGCPVILMHNRRDRNYTNLIEDVKRDLLESVEIARAAGVQDHQILLDPGIGFAKDYDENMKVMASLDQLVGLGFPVLLATSRKRFIQTALGAPAQDVLEGTAATVAYGIAQGCQIVRVHDVKHMKRTAMMCDAMTYASTELQRN
ncbi:dihydropteroate synthase [Paenibacillus lautus]|jgi:dihydropteroate synthase|uniref:Dihydropteroate synthase n=1 Tax=Paenibacillus lautus TaxID=1401 RepID=A0A385TUT9_PAELA|nr:dihydropteroate synthase [Paenibacillus lautus]AYB47201.1 dihydropteroate synthase [Paenibacillus lautus]MBY0164015.1 dihydropteroate synthase [Cytobacillus firmus]MCI1777345.1 dihydropteroate synthase [Paenibacillus lautus]VTR28749.1 dihydropteroate synthase [Actinobacillus pleuropneumoniae]